MFIIKVMEQEAFLIQAGLDSEGRIIINGVDTRKGTIDSYASRYRMQLGFTYKF
jgi:hypothetical protein